MTNLHLSFEDYVNAANPTDEMVGEDGAIARHWQTLVDKLAELSTEDLNARTSEIHRLLQENGITFDSSTDQYQGWQLDPMPMILAEEDWRFLQQGIVQRQKLLNLIYKDIYGPQTLFKEGVLPSNLVRRQKSFIRERVNRESKVPDLFVTAMDIGRDKNGQFKVLADHCQCPNGMGFLLENRVVNRRVMGEEFNELGVQRISRYFQLLQQHISDQVAGANDPRVVILSSGPSHPYYPEHAYLASYMGYTLVRSRDITVRKGKVWLKTLQGLRPIDVILRWVKDNEIDSLELNEYCPDGIPGLLQAVRSGNVKVINPLGAGVVESQALMPFLPAVAQRLLGQDLILESRKIQWLGNGPLDSKARLKTLDGVPVKYDPTEPMSDPANFYNEYDVNLTTAPFWNDGEFHRKAFFLRVFMVNTKDGVYVMPGALCQSVGSDTWVKDTWVRSSQPIESELPLPKTNRNPDIALVEGAVPSRTAENLYWLGRYIERGEGNIRIIRQLLDRHSEVTTYPDKQLQQVVDLFTIGMQNGQLLYPYLHHPAAIAKDKRINCANTINDSIQGSANVGNLAQTLNAIYATSFEVKDLLTDDSWRFVDDIKDEERWLHGRAKSLSTSNVRSALDRMIGYIMAFNGSTADSMPNTNGWFLIEMGRLIERSTQLISQLNFAFAKLLEGTAQTIMIDEILQTQVSLITHRRRYRIYQSVATAIELLVLDAEYPRSLIYQLQKLQELSKKLPAKKHSGLMPDHQKALLKAVTRCHLTDRDTLAYYDDAGQRGQLIELLDDVKAQLEAFDEQLLINYFSHTKKAQAISWANLGSAQDEI